MKDEIFSVITDYGEFTLDYFLKDDVLKEIPIIGPVFSLIKISKDIKDRIFIEKLKSFMDNVDKDQKWKNKFKNENECNKISKQLLYIINSSDDDEKLKLIGKAFNFFIRGEISKDEYFYLNNMINKAFFPYLKLLLEIDESDNRFKNDGKKYNYFGVAHLLSIGLIDETGHTMMTVDKNNKFTPPSIIVSVNSYGDFVKLLLEDNKDQTRACLKKCVNDH